MIISEQAKALAQRIREEKMPKPVIRQSLPSEPSEGMKSVAEMIQASIEEAKHVGVSPEKLAPLYNSLTKALEICAELKGDLDRSSKTLNIVKIDIKKEVEEYARAIELSR